MGKKKKTYVKPEMKIIEVKTEGVIAASGGVIKPGDEYYGDILKESCTSNYDSGGNAVKSLGIGDCANYSVNINGNCSFWNNIGLGVFNKSDGVQICCKEVESGIHKGEKYYVVTKIPNIH